MTVRVGLIGAGKMGIAHLAVLHALPGAQVVAVCDTAGLLLSTLKKLTRIETYRDHREMIDHTHLDAVIVATPTGAHFACARYALEKDLHVFVEKPLTVSGPESRVLAELARDKKRVAQVGYHDRFVGTFQEARRLIRAGALGSVRHLHARASTQTQVEPHGWRARRSEGGGCLRDFACHALDLLEFVHGPAARVIGARLQSIHSRDLDDAVYALLDYPSGASGLLEACWTDETARKSSLQLIVQGTAGKLEADTLGLQVFLRSGHAFESYREGWTLREAAELQAPTEYVLRGEPYTAQLAAFVRAVESRDLGHEASFASAHETDRLIDLIAQASHAGQARS